MALERWLPASRLMPIENESSGERSLGQCWWLSVGSDDTGDRTRAVATLMEVHSRLQVTSISSGEN